MIFYCASQVDYVVIEQIYKYFPEAKIVAKTRTVKKTLQKFGVKASVYPSFPDILVMPRHVARKFPEPRMIKIGLRHGAYHFKDFVSAKRYNAFDIYFVTSIKEEELAFQHGITNAKAIGYPKLDPAFNNSISKKTIEQYRKKLGLNKKPVILFSATWNKSGMSAIDRWVHRISELNSDYQILVTVHQWTTKENLQILENTQGIYFIKDKNILPYLKLADVMISDMSSIIAEFCALDKPIITFKITAKPGARISEEIQSMLPEISLQINTFDELNEAIKQSLLLPNKQSAQRKKYNKIMFDELDGKAGYRAASIIRERFFKS